MIEIIEAEPREGHRLFIRFRDGAEGIVRLQDFVPFEGVFEALKDPALFAQVRVDRDLGTVCWPNGADLDPLVLYSRVTGKPISWAEPQIPLRP